MKKTTLIQIARFSALASGVYAFVTWIESGSYAIVFVWGLFLAVSWEATYRIGKIHWASDAVEDFVHYVKRIAKYYKDNHELKRQPHEHDKEYEFRKTSSIVTANAMEALAEVLEK